MHTSMAQPVQTAWLQSSMPKIWGQSPNLNSKWILSSGDELLKWGDWPHDFVRVLIPLTGDSSEHCLIDFTKVTPSVNCLILARRGPSWKAREALRPTVQKSTFQSLSAWFQGTQISLQLQVPKSRHNNPKAQLQGCAQILFRFL